MKTNLLDEEKLIKTSKAYELLSISHKAAFIRGAHYAAEELEKKLPRWIPVKEELNEIKPFLYLTKNDKTGYFANKKLDDWLIDKYSITHYMSIDSLPEPPKEKEE